MQKYLFIVLLLFCSMNGFSQNKDHILGKWLNATGEAHIQIYANGNKFFGKLAWLKAVSYTHLDVYKRQTPNAVRGSSRCLAIANAVDASSSASPKKVNVAESPFTRCGSVCSFERPSPAR